MESVNNRRRHERVAYPDTGIKTVIQKVEGAGTKDCRRQDIRVVDFSRSGLGIQSANHFAVGDTLYLSMSLAEGPPLALTAVICNRRQLQDEYRYGAFFEYEVLPKDHKSDQLLEQVEMDLGVARS